MESTPRPHYLRERGNVKPYYDHGGITIYHGDCREILPTLPPVDLVLTDPPYGMDWHGHGLSTQTWNGLQNDDGDLDLRPILNMPCEVVAFGANCYPEQLPHRGRWICWDKRVVESADKMLGSPFELAWRNIDHGYDTMVRLQHGGVVNADGGKQKRVHPTQKPVGLMARIIHLYPKTSETILDPFMGSGTTLRAAKDLGRKAIGIEIEEKYCEIAAKRLAQEVLF